MKFTLRKISDKFENVEIVEVNTLEDLKALQENACLHFDDKSYINMFEEPCLIVDFRDMTITYYDDYYE